MQLGTLLLYVTRVGTSLSLGTLEKARAPLTAARRRSFEAMGSRAGVAKMRFPIWSTKIEEYGYMVRFLLAKVDHAEFQQRLFACTLRLPPRDIMRKADRRTARSEGVDLDAAVQEKWLSWLDKPVSA